MIYSFEKAHLKVPVDENDPASCLKSICHLSSQICLVWQTGRSSSPTGTTAATDARCCCCCCVIYYFTLTVDLYLSRVKTSRGPEEQIFLMKNSIVWTWKIERKGFPGDLFRGQIVKISNHPSKNEFLDWISEQIKKIKSNILEALQKLVQRKTR